MEVKKVDLVITVTKEDGSLLARKIEFRKAVRGEQEVSEELRQKRRCARTCMKMANELLKPMRDTSPVIKD